MTLAEWKKILVEGDASELSATDSSDIADVGTVEAAGTGSTASRVDHVHTIGTGAIDAANLFAADVVENAAIAADAIATVQILNSAVTTAKITASAVTTAKINIDDNLDFNANSALDFGLETVSSMTSSEATTSEFVGRIVFDNTNSRPYIYI